MKDDRTPEQKEREEYQDEFLSDVKSAVDDGKKVKDGGEPQGRLMKVMKKVKRVAGMKNNAEGEAREKNVDVNALEKIYQQNRKDVNDENVTNMINPKYQSPKSQQKKNPVDDAVKKGGIKVRKVLGG